MSNINVQQNDYYIKSKTTQNSAKIHVYECSLCRISIYFNISRLKCLSFMYLFYFHIII